MADYARTAKNPRIKKENQTNRGRKYYFKKGFGDRNVRLPEQFSLVKKLKKSHPVTRLCQVLGVHRSSYKYWVKVYCKTTECAISAATPSKK